MKRQAYTKSLPREMYVYFLGYDEAGSAPSFQKFAAHKGLTLEELLSFKVHKKFDEAYRECSEIRRDYLIDRALCKRFDPSFVKFLISDECEAENGNVEIKLEVVE